MSPEKSVSLAYLEALNRRDWPALSRLLTPNATAVSPLEIPMAAESLHRQLIGSSIRLRARLRGLTEGTTESGKPLVIASCQLRWTMRGIGSIRCPGAIVLQFKRHLIGSVELIYDSLQVQELRQEEFLQKVARPPKVGDPEAETFTLVRAAVSELDASAAPIPVLDRQRIERDIVAYEELLNRPAAEPEVQKFLASRLYFWGHELRLGTPDTPLFSQVRLGSEFVCDFVYYDMGSDGMEWNLVEIEAPSGRLFNADGEFSQGLNHAVAQVRRWQQWVNDNHSLADQLMPGVMLPLGMIFMGRRSELEDDKRREHLHYYNSQHRATVVIHTLDHFLDCATGALAGHEIATPRRALTGTYLRDKLPASVRAWAHGLAGNRTQFLRTRMAGTNVSAD